MELNMGDLIDMLEEMGVARGDRAKVGKRVRRIALHVAMGWVKQVLHNSVLSAGDTLRHLEDEVRRVTGE